MADTQRTRAALLALMADNVTGNVSAQDFRDFIVTVMDAEFVNPGDYWRQPIPDQVTTDKTGRGWMDYSQVAGSALSFMDALYLVASNEWRRADVADSTTMPVIGIAMDSYASDATNLQVLRGGIIYDSALSARFSGQIGRFVYLASGDAGSVSVTLTANSNLVLGVVEPNGIGSVVSGKWRFDPEWAVKGQ